MAPLGDRRCSPRASCDISVEYTCAGYRPQDGRIANIGTGGVLLATPDVIPVGTTVVLRFDLPPSNRPIRAVGEVKWLDQEAVGVGFAGLSVWEQQVVWQYYAKVAPR